MLNGFDTDLPADQTRVTNRLRDALTSISPVLKRALGSRLHQAGVRDLAAAFPILTALRVAGPDKVRETIARRPPRLASKAAEAVAKALAAQDVTVPAEAATGGASPSWTGSSPGGAPLGKEIEEAFLSQPFGEILASLPGIGPRTGARILAEIGDGTGFASGAKLAAYPA